MGITQLTVSFNRQFINILEEIKLLRRGRTIVQILREAIALYKFLLRNSGEGYEIAVVKDGNIVELVEMK